MTFYNLILICWLPRNNPICFSNQLKLECYNLGGGKRKILLVSLYITLSIIKNSSFYPLPVTLQHEFWISHYLNSYYQHIIIFFKTNKFLIYFVLNYMFIRFRMECKFHKIKLLVVCYCYNMWEAIRLKLGVYKSLYLCFWKLM